MTAILRDSTNTVVVVVCTRPRAIPLAMITMRKSLHGLRLVSYMGMGLRLAGLRAAGAPLLRNLLFRAQRGSKYKFYTLHDTSLESANFLKKPLDSL